MIQSRLPLSEKLDVIIFGASGFAGRHTVLEAVDILKNVRWGIAGRNKKKLQAVIDKVNSKTDTDLCKIPIFIADANDSRTLCSMVKNCRILVNCCGPHYLNGEAVIKACIEANTHYVDLSSEPQFMELMQLKYDELAKKNSVYVVSACGFHCIPTEIGIKHIMENFEGTLNLIEAYTEYWCSDKNWFGPIATSTVWASFVMSLATIKEMPAIRNQLFQKTWPQLTPISFYKAVLQNSDVVSGVCVPFPIIETQVAERTQYHFYAENNMRPIQFKNYITLPSAIAGLLFFFWCFVIALLAQFQRSRELLLKHPRVFTFGFFCEAGPTEESLEKIIFRITFNAVGWSKTDKNPHYQYEEEPDKRLVAKVSGRNPVYGVACTTILTSALMILEHESEMPGSGGVLPPGAAFADTDIISELEKHDDGIAFEIIRI